MSKFIKTFVFAAAAAIVLATPAFAGVGNVTVPEPSSILMLAGGIGAVAGLRYYLLRKR